MDIENKVKDLYAKGYAFEQIAYLLNIPVAEAYDIINPRVELIKPKQNSIEKTKAIAIDSAYRFLESVINDDDFVEYSTEDKFRAAEAILRARQ